MGFWDKTFKVKMPKIFGTKHPQVQHDPQFQAAKNLGIPLEMVTNPEVALGIPWVYACIRLIGNTMKKADLRVYPRRKITSPIYNVTPYSAVDSDHQLKRLLDRPNPYMTGSQLVEGTQYWLELAGNCYWVLDELDGTGENSKPKTIWIVDPRNMKIVPNDQGLIEGYVYEVGGKRVPYEPWEVIHFKQFNPFHPLLGLGTIQAAAALLQEQMLREQYDRNFYERGAIISAVLETNQTFDPVTFRRLRREFKKMHEGAQNSHRTAILEGGVTYKPVAPSHTEMDKIQGDKYTREKILATFNIPPSKLGIMEDANFSNSTEQDKTFLSESIIPRLNYIEEVINNDLAPRYGGRGSKQVLVAFDDIMPQNEETLTKTIHTLSMTGLFKINELRGMGGYPPIPGGEELSHPPGADTVINVSGGGGGPAQIEAKPISQADPAEVDNDPDTHAGDKPSQPENTPNAVIRDRERNPKKMGFIVNKKFFSIEQLSEQRLREIWKRIDSETKALRDYLTQQENRVVARLLSQRKAQSQPNIEEAFNDPNDDGRLEMLLLALAIFWGGQGFGVIKRIAGQELKWDPNDPMVKELLDRISSQYKGINDYIRQRIIKTVEEGLKRGYSMNQIISGVEEESFVGIADIYENLRAFKAEQWIGDSMIDSYNLGSLIAAKALGETKVFVTDGTEHDRGCKEANGSIWTIERAWANPKEHPRCKRAFWLVPKKEGSNEQEEVADRHSDPEG